MEESGSGSGLYGLLNLEVHELGSSTGEVGSGTIESQISLYKVNAESSVVQRKIEIEAKGCGGSSVQGELLFVRASAEVILGFSEQPVSNGRHGIFNVLSYGCV